MVLVIDWHWTGDKLLPEPMLTWCPLHYDEQISVKLISKCTCVLSRKCISKCHLQNVSHFVRPQYVTFRALFEYPLGHLIVRSRKDLKPQDFYLELDDRSEIWHSPWQQCCWGACQILKWCHNSKYQSLCFEISQDLMIRRLIRYCNRTQVSHSPSLLP